LAKFVASDKGSRGRVANFVASTQIVDRASGTLRTPEQWAEDAGFHSATTFADALRAAGGSADE
jgi:hypothetical protein